MHRVALGVAGFMQLRNRRFTLLTVARPDPCFLDKMEKVSRQGGQRWRNADRDRFYEWDDLHGEIEVYNRRGTHLGAADPETGVFIKDPVRGRRIDV